MRAVAVALALAACGGRATPRPPSRTTAHAGGVTVDHRASAGDRLIAILPEDAQVIVEVDLARLRANSTVGPLVARLLADPHTQLDAQPSLLADADVVVLAAYGVGTAEAATVTLVGLRAGVQPNLGRVIAPGVVALGPASWLDQVAARQAIPNVAAASDLYALRDRAMPAAAPGAALRVVARLSFDARIALARMTGLEAAPERLSIWGDVVDDLAIIADADGGKDARQTQTLVRAALASFAGDPVASAIGIRSSLESARISTHGAWVRAIIAIGPSHLQRAAARALAGMKVEP
ncbi:MAG: hypothetical protein NT062_14595 [Proteobacteria bacterium]|nr:hypothetical protein [Pseudomonadota bacterium]